MGRGTTGVSILGASGSIGASALSVIREHRDRFRVTALAVNVRWEPLLPLIEEFNPSVVAVSDPEAARALKSALGRRRRPRVVGGPEALVEAACVSGTDVTLCACSGAVGLVSAVAAIEAGIRLALANKEVLVAGGELVTRLARRHKVPVVPVDSEHSAVFQAIRDEGAALRTVMLTASGGPFRGWTRERLAGVTPADALRHPNWAMGRKITVDSATLMNKGLEVIEARWLFDVDYDDIRVVVHPQSVIHSLAEFHDGSVLAQLGLPDMRLPILYALGWPERVPAPWMPRLDLVTVANLSFLEPDREAFPSLELAYRAGRLGGSFPTVLNAVNEVAVAAFLDEGLPFVDIPAVVEEVLDGHEATAVDSVGAILDVDARSRALAREALARRRGM